MRPSLALLLFAALAGCRGALLGKAELHGEGTAEARFQKAQKPVVLWGHVEGKWRGGKNDKLPVVWDVEVVQEGKTVGRVTCDVDDVRSTLCGVHTFVNGEHEAGCELALACQLPSLAAGEVVLRVTGRKLRPAQILSIVDMSLLVRED